MTAYVLDASLAAAWFLPDEASDAADRLLGDALADAPVVPSLFRHELETCCSSPNGAAGSPPPTSTRR